MVLEGVGCKGMLMRRELVCWQTCAVHVHGCVLLFPLQQLVQGTPRLCIHRVRNTNSTTSKEVEAQLS